MTRTTQTIDFATPDIFYYKLHTWENCKLMFDSCLCGTIVWYIVKIVFFNKHKFL